ncbi:alpha-glucoside ABC transporter substrate-binding protein [Planomonospora parontospora subsp. parontospora]|uniref:Alpha-glucoside ABC transporter substrate-binding protein n=2 Tax=Planomonospora parontospora TaxID=58119 RepID=A0AA37F6Z3_9ACTN|nr:ABC transporter substrate-binding protein [Planomonospora parontospora]GGK88658.1 alpha-glucoside ABC transporter substrate-binding protein [Planomonospora parontospora]GII11590.1 alpha-glucoside ABC transporter substrate-binding protein [Planomonospora parontospora subsp. parontospora]
MSPLDTTTAPQPASRERKPMKSKSRSGRTAAAGALGALSCLLLAACGAADAAQETEAGRAAACAPYAAYRGHEGTTVSVLMTGNLDGVRLAQALRRFSDCTSIRIDIEGNTSVEDEVRKRAGTGNAPDLAIIAQPGLIAELVGSGDFKPAPDSVAKLAKENWAPGWLEYGSVDGTLYAVPYDSSVKSFVWYSPAALKKGGHAVPETWDEMMAVSEKIAASGGTPWCVGFESGGATGWPGTDWLEDVMLRVHGPEVYDQWVTHAIPFDDPKVVEAADLAAKVLKNDRYVRGGTAGIAEASFTKAGQPVLENRCTFYRMASFYAGNWPRGTKVAADGDVFAFQMPAVDPAKGKPALVASTFVGAFGDRPEVVAVQEYLASADFAGKRVAAGSWTTANNKVDLDLYTGDIDKLSAEIMRDPGTVVRFDASDMMPAAVGAGSFWTGMTDWVGGKGTKQVLAEIERSWP